MTIQTWWVYLGTVLLLMSTPGPSHLLMMSVSMNNGFYRSLVTAAGDLTANVIQMMLAGFGLATLLLASKYGFAVVKWCGVAYLAWLGYKHIASSFRPAESVSQAPLTNLKKLWFSGFITSAANPKAVIFFAALFPQFIEQQSPVLPQIVILGATYILVDGLFLSFYGKSASWLAGKINAAGRSWIDRIAGTGLIAAAVLLGLKSNRLT